MYKYTFHKDVYLYESSLQNMFLITDNTEFI